MMDICVVIVDMVRVSMKSCNECDYFDNRPDHPRCNKHANLQDHILVCSDYKERETRGA